MEDFITSDSVFHTDGQTYYEFCKHHGIYVGGGEVVQKVPTNRSRRSTYATENCSIQKHECIFPLQDVIELARKYAVGSNYTCLKSMMSCQHFTHYYYYSLVCGEPDSLKQNLTQSIKTSFKMSLCWVPTAVTVAAAYTLGPVAPLVELSLIAAVSLTTVGGVVGSIATVNGVS